MILGFAMNKKEAEKKIDKLRLEIDKQRYNYHVLDKETMDEAVLDGLKSDLFKLELAYPDLITPDSPTQRVAGEPLDKFEKVSHLLPMVSLFDAFSKDDMTAWQKRNENYLKRLFKEDYYCELKLDGLAISIRYQSKKLSLAATRGNGRIGENVSLNTRTIASVPLAIRSISEKELLNIGIEKDKVSKLLSYINSGKLEVRGEAIIKKSVFRKLNKDNLKAGRIEFANTRNAVAGSIRQLDPKVTASRRLDFFAYDLIFPQEERGALVHYKHHLDDLLRLLGFKVLANNSIAKNLEEVFTFYTKVEKEREALDFEIDGVVVKVNDLRMWPKLGVVGKAPRYMMAYKFSAEQARTKLLDVIWQLGRTGVLTPIAVLEPVRVGGALISRATLHNFDEINRLGIKINDTLILERSGDVIPKIISVIKSLRIGNEKIIKVPSKCPRCEGEVERLSGEVAYRCINPNCYAVSLRQIYHFVSKGGADLAGLGPKLIEQFMASALIKDASDLYTLKKSDLLGLERIGEKKADNIVELISARKNIELAHFIYALGIRHVGEETASTLASDFLKTQRELKASLSEGVLPSTLSTYFRKQSLDYLSNLADIGEVVANSIYDYFNNEDNLNFITKLEKNDLRLKINSSLDGTLGGQNQAIKDKTFVLTGTLSSLTRQAAKDRIKALGGKTKESITKDLDYLVYGDSPGSKLAKAKEAGIKTLNESEFIDLLDKKQ